MFPLRKGSVHKCVYTNAYTIVSTLSRQQTRSPVSGSRSEGKVILIMLWWGSVTDHLTKRIRLLTIKGSLPIAGVDPHGGFQTPATNLLGG